MSRFERSIPSAYFDDIYAADPDPWRFATSAYEREKYAATLAALPHERYARALEIGCSIGVMTRMLAARCDDLQALDVADAPLREAARRCADLAHVRFALTRVPSEWPSGQFDLILLSEVVYYLDRDDIDLLAARIGAAALPGCDIVLVHWLGETHYPLTGEEAAEQLIASLGQSASVTHQARTKAYRLDVLEASA